MKAVEYLPNKLTPFNFKIYYKEENYLKVKTVVLKYTTPPYSKGSVYQYIGTLSMWVYKYIQYIQYIYNHMTRLPFIP